MRSQRKQICAAVVVQLVAVVDVDVVGVILMTSRVVKWWWFSRRYGILQSMRCCSSGGGESLPLLHSPLGLIERVSLPFRTSQAASVGLPPKPGNRAGKKERNSF